MLLFCCFFIVVLVVVVVVVVVVVFVSLDVAVGPSRVFCSANFSIDD